MSETVVLELAQSALQVALFVAAPLLLVSLLIGIVVSLVQVATSLQDVTLTFVPKIVAVGLALMLVGQWMIQTLIDFTHQLVSRIPGMLG